MNDKDTLDTWGVLSHLGTDEFTPHPKVRTYSQLKTARDIVKMIEQIIIDEKLETVEGYRVCGKILLAIEKEYKCEER